MLYREKIISRHFMTVLIIRFFKKKFMKRFSEKVNIRAKLKEIKASFPLFHGEKPQGNRWQMKRNTRFIFNIDL